jgi:hypothetical protein
MIGDADLSVGFLSWVVFEPGEGGLHQGQQFGTGGICPQGIEGSGGFSGGSKLSRHADDRP